MATPKEDGFFMPAEWHPHTATWMAWPGLEEAYINAPMGPEKAFKQAKACYGEVAWTIARFETVNMLANKESIEEAKAHCGPDVNIIEAEIDDGWFRDSGPTFVINDKGRLAGVNWVFNGWGDKYTHANDASRQPGLFWIIWALNALTATWFRKAGGFMWMVKELFLLQKIAN